MFNSNDDGKVWLHENTSSDISLIISVRGMKTTEKDVSKTEVA